MNPTKNAATKENFMSPSTEQESSIEFIQSDPKTRSMVSRNNRDDVPRGTERIVLAEDDSRIRGVTFELLEDLGYRVEAYANGMDVLNAIARDQFPVELLLTDYDMPGLTGYELSQRIRAEHPGLRMIITSGWSEDSILPQSASMDWPPFLPKPYTLRTLARKIREVLDRPSPESYPEYGASSQ